MRDPGSSAVFTTWLPAPPDEVWSAFTCAAATARFFHGLAITSTWRPGDGLTLTASKAAVEALTGTVLRAVPGAELAFSIDDWSGTATLVAVALRASNGGCVVTLTVDEFPDGASTPTELEDAWLAVLEGLRAEVTAPA